MSVTDLKNFINKIDDSKFNEFHAKYKEIVNECIEECGKIEAEKRAHLASPEYKRTQVGEYQFSRSHSEFATWLKTTPEYIDYAGKMIKERSLLVDPQNTENSVVNRYNACISKVRELFGDNLINEIFEISGYDISYRTSGRSLFSCDRNDPEYVALVQAKEAHNAELRRIETAYDTFYNMLRTTKRAETRRITRNNPNARQEAREARFAAEADARTRFTTDHLTKIRDEKIKELRKEFTKSVGIIPEVLTYFKEEAVV